MSETTAIEWADSTFNPWIGCTRVSPACDDCYAARSTPARALGVAWGPAEERRRTSAANWALPKRWNAQAEAFQAQHGRRQRVFCASLADVFDNEAPDEWRQDLFTLILNTPNLDWLLLTKRIGNVQRMLRGMVHGADPDLTVLDMMPLPNVWVGATICNQEEADRDIPKLLAVPARVRFLSIEPMLGPIDLTRVDLDGDREIYPLAGTTECVYASGDPCPDVPALSWVICGGESGPQARPMHPDWARALRDQCAAAGVPFLFKQWGEWLPICEHEEAFTNRLYRSNRKAEPHEDQGAIDDLYGRTCTVPYEVTHRDGSRHHPLEPNAFIAGAMTTFKVGKKAAGRHLDGVTHDGFPTNSLEPA